MGFDVLRASVGCVHPGAATGTVTFDHVCFVDHGRRFVAFKRRRDES